MAKIIQRKKPKQADAASDEGFDPNTTENQGLDYQWLDTALKDKERSKIRRKMKARRELERRQDEKHLKALIYDEWF